MIDVVETRNTVVDFLALHGFKPRDADGSDFARPGTATRFKVGTSMGEVAITVWDRTKQVDVIRVVSPGSLEVALNYIGVAAG